MPWADGSSAALGHEATPEKYIAHLLEVCAGVWRVLRDDGVFFLNIDDSRYGSGGPGGDYRDGRGGDEYLRRYESGKVGRGKDMALVPEMLALALQAQGWYIRSKIAWIKTPMPESALDRAVDAWEVVLMLTKGASYYWDDEAMRVASEPGTPVRGGRKSENSKYTDTPNLRGIHPAMGPSGAGHRPWNVLYVPQEPLPTFYKDGQRLDHHAAFPPGLPAWGIRATTSEMGCCPACGAQWRRVVEREAMLHEVLAANTKSPEDSAAYRIALARDIERRKRNRGPDTKMSFSHLQLGSGQKLQGWYNDHPTRTVGWEPGCQCEAGDPVPPTVLDPFVGSGTTCVAAFELGRRSVGVDISDGYLEIARQRLATAQWPSARMALEPRLQARRALDVQLEMLIE